MLFTTFAAWLLADFATGLVHWAEDRLLLRPSRVRFLDNIRLDNDLHHIKPTAMLKHTAWQNINTSVAFTVPLGVIMFVVGAPDVVLLAIFFASFANLIHRWAHTPARHLNPIVRVLQVVGVFSSSEQHGRHHYYFGSRISKEDTRGTYCPMTDWLNPALDALEFWRHLERLVGKRE